MRTMKLMGKPAKTIMLTGVTSYAVELELASPGELIVRTCCNSRDLEAAVGTGVTDSTTTPFNIGLLPGILQIQTLEFSRLIVEFNSNVPLQCTDGNAAHGGHRVELRC